MPETRGMPELRPWWLNDFVLEALAMRPDDEYGLRASGMLASRSDEPEFFNASAEDAYRASPGSVRSRRTRESVAAVLRDALGDAFDPDDFDMADLDDIVTNELADPQAALDALDAALADPRGRDREKAKAGESSGMYKIKDGNWREKNGMPRKRQNRGGAPSEQPEARRARRMQDKARRLGISVEEAEAMTRRRSDLGVKRGPRHGSEHPTP